MEDPEGVQMYLVIQDIGTERQHALMELLT
jgi:hypothetical protein